MTTSSESTASQSVSLDLPCTPRFSPLPRLIADAPLNHIWQADEYGPIYQGHEKPDLAHRIAERQINWNILHQLLHGFSTTGA